MLCFYTISAGFIAARDALSSIGLPERSINISLNIKIRERKQVLRSFWKSKEAPSCALQIYFLCDTLKSCWNHWAVCLP